MHMEAKVIRITFDTGEWAFSFQWASFFLCCGRMAKLFLSSVDRWACLYRGTRSSIRALTKDGPELRDGSFDPFLWGPACCRRWRTHRASVCATRFGTPAAWQIHTHQPTHPAPHLVPTTVGGPGGTGRFVFAKGSSITHQVPLWVKQVYEVTILTNKRRETDAIIPNPSYKKKANKQPAGDRLRVFDPITKIKNKKWGQQSSNGRPRARLSTVVTGVHR